MHAAAHRSYTLTLVRERLHPLIPKVFTVEGLAHLTLAQARAAGEAHRAQRALQAGRIATFLGPARVRRAALARVASDAKAAVRAAKEARADRRRAARLALQDKKDSKDSSRAAYRQKKCAAALEEREVALEALLKGARTGGGGLPATLPGLRSLVGEALLLEARAARARPPPLPRPVEHRRSTQRTRAHNAHTRARGRRPARASLTRQCWPPATPPSRR